MRPAKKLAIAVFFLWGMAVLTGCGSPNAIGNMPGPVQQVVNTPTLSGNALGDNMLIVTGNRAYIGTGKIPGYYNYGPADGAANNTYYVNFEIPVNLADLRKQLGFGPHPVISSTLPDQVYINIQPLPNESYDRLYYSPTTHLARFSFKLNANGTVMDESWDAVAVNS